MTIVLFNPPGGSSSLELVITSYSIHYTKLYDIALKPTSSLRLPGKTVNREGWPVEVVTEGRHDPCVGIRATPIAEAMMAIVVMDHVLRHRGQNMDVKSGLRITSYNVCYTKLLREHS